VRTIRYTIAAAAALAVWCGCGAPADDDTRAGDPADDTADDAAARPGTGIADGDDAEADGDDTATEDAGIDDDALDPETHPDVITDDGPWIRSRGAYVVDRSSGEVLFSRRADRPRPMASIAKLMGVLTYLSTDPDLEQVITITRADAYTPSFTRSPLYIGSSYRAADVLHQALMESDNRAMMALARATGLTGEEFGAAMNATAAEIGLRQAVFVEPTGINADNMITPFEATVLLDACLADPLLAEIMARENYSYQRVDRPRKLVAQTTNMLMRMDHWEVLGSKTGYTCVAGSCLVMLAHIEGRELMLALLGHPDVEMRFNDAGELRWWLKERQGNS
jgi:D-alanyl-D-alanine endopeptidase (penicillin-binding protein 7)